MPKERRIFNRINRKYRKQLQKLARSHKQYDYGEVLEFMKIIFNHWIDFYTLGYKVMALEIEGVPSRLEIATNLKSLLEKVDDTFFEEQDEALEKFTIYFFKYIRYMWD